MSTSSPQIDAASADQAAADHAAAPAGSPGSFTEQAQRRGCYCGLWDTNPRMLQIEKLPAGTCAFCDLCGRPGHHRTFPGPLKNAGRWCDRCYNLRLWLSVRGRYGQYIWFAAVVLTGAAAVTWLIL